MGFGTLRIGSGLASPPIEEQFFIELTAPTSSFVMGNGYILGDRPYYKANFNDEWTLATTTTLTFSSPTSRIIFGGDWSRDGGSV